MPMENESQGYSIMHHEEQSDFSFAYNSSGSSRPEKYIDGFEHPPQSLELAETSNERQVIKPNPVLGANSESPSNISSCIKVLKRFITEDFGLKKNNSSNPRYVEVISKQKNESIFSDESS